VAPRQRAHSLTVSILLTSTLSFIPELRSAAFCPAQPLTPRHKTSTVLKTAFRMASSQLASAARSPHRHYTPEYKPCINNMQAKSKPG